MSTTEALFEAVRTDNAGAIGDILDREPELLGEISAEGATLLLTALYHGADGSAALLLSRGATVDIFEAAAMGNTGRIREILADDPSQLRRMSHDGWTPLHLAGFFGGPEAAALLLEHGADVASVSGNTTANMPLHAALAGRRDRRTIELLLEHGADVNAPAHGGYTPLHLAASRGDIDLIQLLLERGADRSARMSNGQTPSDLALERNHPDAAQLLSPVGESL